MRTLELKDIFGYLPHELKVLINDEVHDALLTLGIRGNKQNISTNIDNGRPILRPLSDMYKPILHNGEEIIPIVECAKISDNIGWHLNTDRYLPPSAVHGSKKGSRSYLQFNTGMFIIRYENSKDYQNEPYEGDVKNQYKLFDFLYELKIDYRGLIESGLAIDCNTLENNPYK